MFYNLGVLVARRARLVLALALVAVAACAVVGVGAFAKLGTGGFDDPKSDYSKATELIYAKFGGAPDIVFMVHAEHGTVDDSAAAAGGKALTARLAGDQR